MALKFPHYLMQDTKTRLGEEYFNPILKDIDSRIHALEILRATLELEISKLTDLGLLRINELIVPVLAEAQATAQELLDIVAAAQVDIAAAFEAQSSVIEGLSDAVNTTLTALSTDVTEQIDGFADLLNALNEKMRVGRGIVIVDAADLAAADMGNTGTAPFSTISHPITLQGGDLPNSLTIQVAAGTYTEAVTCAVNKNLTIINTSQRVENVQISTLTLPESPTFNEMHVHLSHVTVGTIQLPTTAGQWARGTLVLENCVITGQILAGINSSQAISITARNCVFSHSAPFDALHLGGYDIDYAASSSKLQISDCSFTYSGVSIAPRAIAAVGAIAQPPLRNCRFSSLVLSHGAVYLDNCTTGTLTLKRGGEAYPFSRVISNCKLGLVQFGEVNQECYLDNCTLSSSAPYVVSSGGYSDNWLYLRNNTAIDTATAIDPAVFVDSVRGTPLGSKLSATATLDFPSINAHASADLTVTVNRAAVGDEVAVIPPSTLLTNMVAYGFVSAANTVTVRLLNNSTAAQNPASGSFKVIVRK